MYCSHCGSKLFKSDKFCHQCGEQTNFSNQKAFQKGDSDHADEIDPVQKLIEEKKSLDKKVESLSFSYWASILLILILSVFILNLLHARYNPSREVVYNSDSDGSVKQVVEFLKNNLTDPDSYEPIQWSVVAKLMGHQPKKFVVWHKYKAKNSFGSYFFKHQIFYFEETGEIIDFKDFSTDIEPEFKLNWSPVFLKVD